MAASDNDDDRGLGQRMLDAVAGTDPVLLALVGGVAVVVAAGELAVRATAAAVTRARTRARVPRAIARILPLAPLRTAAPERVDPVAGVRPRFLK